MGRGLSAQNNVTREWTLDWTRLGLKGFLCVFVWECVTGIIKPHRKYLAVQCLKATQTPHVQSGTSTPQDPQTFSLLSCSHQTSKCTWQYYAEFRSKENTEGNKKLKCHRDEVRGQGSQPESHTAIASKEDDIKLASLSGENLLCPEIHRSRSTQEIMAGEIGEVKTYGKQ